MTQVRSLRSADLASIGGLFDGLFAVFDPADFRALYINPAGRSFLDPSLSLSPDKLLLTEMLGVSEIDRFNHGIWPRAKVMGEWNGTLILRDFSGSETVFYARMVEVPDTEYSGARRLYLYASLKANSEDDAKHVSDSEMLRALLETIPDWVYFKDTKSRFIRVSNALSQSLGLPEATAAIGKTDFDFFASDHATPAFEQEMRIIKTGVPLLNFEEKETYADGRINWVSTTKLPFKRRDGSLIGTYGISRNISEKKEAEAAMQDNLALFRAVFDGSNDGILLMCEDRFIDCNLRAVNLFGWEKTLLLEKTLLELSVPNQPDGLFAEKILPELKGKAFEKGYSQFEWLFKKADGQTFPAEVTLSTFDHCGQRIIHGSVHDLTQRKKAEIERRDLESRLQLTSKLESVGSLAAGVAHEINTPTQFVSDNIRFLVDAYTGLDQMFNEYHALMENAGKFAELTGDLKAVRAAEEKNEIDYMRGEIPRCLQQSLDGLRRIAKIVGSLKEFSHPGGQLFDEADLNRAVETTVAVSRHEWKYVADVITELDPNLPKVPCVIDEINQALLNLVVNASHTIADANKARGVLKGAITIRTRLDGDHAIVEVQDTGMGVPEDVRGRIFEPFFTTKPVGRGTGQGLAIVQAVVVKKHHGSVRFTTELGKGTTFILALPLARPTEADAAQKTL